MKKKFSFASVFSHKSHSYRTLFFGKKMDNSLYALKHNICLEISIGFDYSSLGGMMWSFHCEDNPVFIASFSTLVFKEAQHGGGWVSHRHQPRSFVLFNSLAASLLLMSQALDLMKSLEISLCDYTVIPLLYDHDIVPKLNLLFNFSCMARDPSLIQIISS